jgi:hypothetical protein
MRNLPPLNALRVFEVAARTGSYAAAAEELGLTHGAVSRHMATLEHWLGQKLFRREGRRMVVTPVAGMFARRSAMPSTAWRWPRRLADCPRHAHPAGQCADQLCHALVDPPPWAIS